MTGIGFVILFGLSSLLFLCDAQIRLCGRYPYRGYVQIKDGSTWRFFVNKTWDKNDQKMLCRHLGFNSTKSDVIFGRCPRGIRIASGNLRCYITNSNRSSCKFQLETFIAAGLERVPYVRCKICNKPLLTCARTFANKVFSGKGGSDYQNAKFSRSGWCAPTLGTYLLLDLHKEYHITHVALLGNRDQTMWSSSYAMQYSHAETLVHESRAKQITGNNNGYQASVTKPKNVFNARYIKIKSTETGNRSYCIRIELCGKVQKPAPVYDITITPYQYTARVTWRIRTTLNDSSYITNVIICLNGSKCQTKPRGSLEEIILTGLQPYTTYNVDIVTQDGSFQKSTRISEYFTTREAVPSSPPLNVTFTSRQKNQLEVSWEPPPRHSWNSILIAYQVCYSEQANSSNQTCTLKTPWSKSALIEKLQPAKKYFVTVAAGTTAGFGKKSKEISKITNGDRVNPVPMSHSNLMLNITKPADYIKEVIVIVQEDSGNQKRVEDIYTIDLKPYKTNTQDPYITAYFKTDALPLAFVIGDGKEYNSESENYFNQPLKPSSGYIVFLRFFENQDSYYSTGWSKSVMTLVKPQETI